MFVVACVFRVLTVTLSGAGRQVCVRAHRWVVFYTEAKPMPNTGAGLGDFYQRLLDRDEPRRAITGAERPTRETISLRILP